MAGFQDLRAWMNQHAAIVAAVAVVSVVAVVVLARSCTNTPVAQTPTKVYFMEESTGELVEEPLESLSPLPGKDGRPSRVHAICYTLGADSERQVAYLEKYTEKGRAIAEQLTGDPSVAQRPPTLIRLPEPNSPWVPFESPRGQKILEDFAELSAKPGFRLLYPK